MIKLYAKEGRYIIEVLCLEKSLMEVVNLKFDPKDLYKEDRRSKERRKNDDIWVKFIKLSSVTVWFLTMFMLIFIDMSSPQEESFFTELLSIRPRNSWDMKNLTIAFYIAISSLFYSITVLMVNLKRLKRKSDRISISNIFIMLVSIGVIIFYMTKTLI
ncbi:hypothetical protein WG909_08755 [Peptostreptococcaceae bacterium AGR-M142]